MSDAVKKLDEIIAKLDAIAAKLETAARPVAAAGGPTLPNYGRAKGQPIAGASRDTLEYYRAGCLRTLEDPSKERFHVKERMVLEAIDAELARQGVAPSQSEAPF